MLIYHNQEKYWVDEKSAASACIGTKKPGKKRITHHTFAILPIKQSGGSVICAAVHPIKIDKETKQICNTGNKKRLVIVIAPTPMDVMVAMNIYYHTGKLPPDVSFDHDLFFSEPERLKRAEYDTKMAEKRATRLKAELESENQN